MDESASQAVVNAFVALYRDGLIYRGTRIINWCPVSQTALSDEEVIMKPRRDKLVYVQYSLVNQPGKYITVATVRPETILGDVAIAVNPADPRYRELIGELLFLLQGAIFRLLPMSMSISSLVPVR